MPTKLKKLTLQVPDDLLTRATQATGEGITPTIRRGLELVAAGGAYRNLRSLKGKIKLQLDWDARKTDDLPGHELDNRLFAGSGRDGCDID